METKKYSFSNIRFSNLRELVDIKPALDSAKFEEWFNFSYHLSDNETTFLDSLIKRHAFYLFSYMEEDLKVKFLGPIFNQVDFMTNRFHDWYNAPISGTINGVELTGFADFMVASGIDQVEKPYFFYPRI